MSSDTTPARSGTRLLVLRHGQSEWNALGRWQGHADIELDETGRRQAHGAVPGVVAAGPFEAVWSSDLRRAAVTAEILADALERAPVHLDRRLRENHVGPWEGLTQHEVEHGWPGYLAARRRPEGFEESTVAAARMLDVFRHIARCHPGTQVLAVSHGGVIRATRRAVGGLDQHIPNLAGSWFVIHGDEHVEAGDLVSPADHAEHASEVL